VQLDVFAEPARLRLVAVVEQVGGVVRLEALSPVTKPS